MTFALSEEKLMTVDGRGRVRVPVERREALLDEFERSGLSGVKFARLAGVKYPTFALWVQKRRKARQGAAAGEATKRPVAFAEALVEGETGVVLGGGGGLVIELRGGARIVVGSPVQLSLAAELLRMLGSSGSRRC